MARRLFAPGLSRRFKVWYLQKRRREREVKETRTDFKSGDWNSSDWSTTP